MADEQDILDAPAQLPPKTSGKWRIIIYPLNVLFCLINAIVLLSTFPSNEQTWSRLIFVLIGYVLLSFILMLIVYGGVRLIISIIQPALKVLRFKLVDYLLLSPFYFLRLFSPAYLWVIVHLLLLLGAILIPVSDV